MRYAILAITIAALVGIAAFGQAEKIHIEPIRGNMYMLAESGGNITLQIGPEGIVMVDTGVADRTDDVLAAVQQAAQFHMKIMNGARTPIRYIINTSIDSNHIG